MRELARTICRAVAAAREPSGRAPRPGRQPGAAPSSAGAAAGRGRARPAAWSSGVEELPAADLDAALRHLRTAAPGELERRRLAGGRDQGPRHAAPAWSLTADRPARRPPPSSSGARPGTSPSTRTARRARRARASPASTASPRASLQRVENDGPAFAAAAGRAVDVRTAAADAAETLLGGIPYARGMRWNGRR